MSVLDCLIIAWEDALLELALKSKSNDIPEANREDHTSSMSCTPQLQPLFCGGLKRLRLLRKQMPCQQ